MHSTEKHLLKVVWRIVSAAVKVVLQEMRQAMTLMNA
jgi:hypothetical protein